jgi:hypothetical protein
MSKGWIGVDLDGTLAEYTGWQGASHIGAPVQKMLDRVLRWLDEGKDVRIFTARVSEVDPHDPNEVRETIEEWCLDYIGKVLPITCIKDYGMIQLWDDRCVSVEPNTGEIIKGVELS